MTYPVWPAALPRPDREGWQRRPQEARIKGSNDAGPARRRRRFTSAATLITMSFRFTRSEKAIFDRFFSETTQGGARLFWMPDPTTEGWSILTHDGFGLMDDRGRLIGAGAQWLCQFADDLPTETVSGTDFRITFGLQVMP